MFNYKIIIKILFVLIILAYIYIPNFRNIQFAMPIFDEMNQN